MTDKILIYQTKLRANPKRFAAGKQGCLRSSLVFFTGWFWGLGGEFGNGFYDLFA